MIPLPEHQGVAEDQPPLTGIVEHGQALGILGRQHDDRHLADRDGALAVGHDVRHHDMAVDRRLGAGARGDVAIEGEFRRDAFLRLEDIGDAVAVGDACHRLGAGPSEIDAIEVEIERPDEGQAIGDGHGL